MATTVTNASNGGYQFAGLPPGNYATVQEQDPVGFTSTTPNLVPISLSPGGSATANFGDQPIGTVSGTVYNDLNGNGVQDADEAGIGGVSVALLNGAGTVIASLTTDASGGYRFGNVTPGAYTVAETDPAGYTSTTANNVPVSVPPGGSATANFGNRQPGTVSGTVFNDANGNGLQDAGEMGIGGVSVSLLDGNGTVITTTTTAGNGHYQFTNLPPGSYATVQEQDPAGYTSTTPNLVPISLPPGGSATANFGDQQIGSVSGVVFNDLNGNGGQDAGEPGLGGVLVTLTSSAGTAITTTTASNGTYQFRAITPGSYTVTETDPAGYVSTTHNSVPVTVAAGGAGIANFGDQQQGTVSGTVFNDANGNGVQDPGERGLGGVTVNLLDAAGRVVGTTTTAGSGVYIFANLPPGSYAAVQEQDPAGFTSTTPNLVPISLPPGGAATANFGDQQIGSVSGTVYNDLNGNGLLDSGEPGLGGVSVTLIDNAGTVIATQLTASNGSYLFMGVTPGRYTVSETDPAGFTSTTPNSQPVTVPAGGAPRPALAIIRSAASAAWSTTISTATACTIPASRGSAAC